MPAVALLPFFPTCYHRVNPPSISPSLLLAAHPLPFTLLPVNLASCLHFKLMDLPRKDKEGEPRRQIDIFIYTYIDIHVYWEKKKKKKETWKTSGTFVSFMPNLYSRPKERFRIFFFPASPSQPNHRSTGQNSRWNSRGQDVAVDVHARNIHRRRMRKKSAGWFARVDCVDSWIQTGKGEGDAATEKSSSDFLNGDAWNSLSKSVGGARFSEGERHAWALLTALGKCYECRCFPFSVRFSVPWICEGKFARPKRCRLKILVYRGEIFTGEIETLFC